MTITPDSPPKPVAPDALTLWAARARVAVLEDLTSTGTCVADNLHRIGEPANPRRWGGVFSDPVVRPLMRHAGYTRSTRRQRHGGPVGVWALLPGMEQEAHNRLAAARVILDHLEALQGDGDALPITPAPRTLPTHLTRKDNQ